MVSYSCNVFEQGDENNDELNIKSPNEIGDELTTRIMTINPLSGSIEPYTTIPVNFLCRTIKFHQERGFN